MQSHDSGQHQSLLEEIQWLKEALEKTQDEKELLREDLEKERAERLTLRVDIKKLRSSGHGTSSDQISIQQWRDRAEEAERRIEEAERRIEEAERRIEEAERRAEEADQAALKMRDDHIPDLWRGIQSLFLEKIRQLHGSVKPESVPEDEGEVDRQSQASARAIEDEEIANQDQDGDLAGEGEELEYQSPQVNEDENEASSSTSEPNWGISEEDYAAMQAKSPYLFPNRGAPGRGPQLPPYEYDISSSLEYDSQGDASKPQVRIPGVVPSRSPQELSSGDLKDTSSQPSPSPSRSIISQLQQHQSAIKMAGETARPSDQHMPSASATGKKSDVASPLESLGDMQEALSTLSGSSKPTEQEFPDLPKGSSQIPGIPTASTAPPIQKRPTPVPKMHIASWDLQGPVVKPGTVASFFRTMLGENEPGKEGIPEPEVKTMSPIAAGKQPERPSPAKQASSATRAEPPKPTSTQSYAGATVAPPPKVGVGSTQTAQSSRTVLKPGNAAAKAAGPPTDAPPADQANENTDTGFQTVGPRKARDSSGRGRGSLGRGEAGSNKGGHQGPKFGNWQYEGRGGHGGNPRGGNRRGGNQGGNQGQART